jgi:hypothetical protein
MSYQDRRKVRVNKLIEAAISRIELDIIKEDNVKPGLTIDIKNLSKVNPDQLNKIAAKSDINIVDEAAETNSIIDVTDSLITHDNLLYVTADQNLSPNDEVSFTRKGVTYTAIVKDKTDGDGNYLISNLKKTTQSTQEPKKVTTPQEDAVFNLKSWAQQLQIEIGDGVDAPNNTLKFSYRNPKSGDVINILVMSNGLIKMSGHVIHDYSDLRNIVNWHSSNG